MCKGKGSLVKCIQRLHENTYLSAVESSLQGCDEAYSNALCWTGEAQL